MSNPLRASGLWLSLSIFMAPLGCSNPASEPLASHLRELVVLLQTAADGEAGEPVRELDARMESLLSVIEIPGHTLTLDSSQQGFVVVFEFSLRDRLSEPVAAVQLFYRPDLPSSVSETYGSELFEGYSSRRLPGEQLFVLAGSFEIRIFQRSEEFHDKDRLRELMALVPLDELERL